MNYSRFPIKFHGLFVYKVSLSLFVFVSPRGPCKEGLQELKLLAILLYKIGFLPHSRFMTFGER